MESSLESSVVELPLPNESSVAASEMLNVKVESATEARVDSHSSSLVFLQEKGNKEMPKEVSRFEMFSVDDKEYLESFDVYCREVTQLLKAESTV